MITTFMTRMITLLLLTTAMAGCGLASDNKEAREVATKFYDALKTADIATAASLCGTDDVMTTQAWEDLFAQNLNTMGKVTSYESVNSFDVSQSGGKSTVKVAYKVSYEYGKSVDSLIIINAGEGFKVYEYSPVVKEARFQEEMAKAKTIATNYMQALQAGDHSKALSYVGYSGSTMHPADEWNAFYVTLETSAGRMTDMQIDDAASLSYINDTHVEAGKGNIYSVVYTTSHSEMTVYHQVDLFQPAFGGELKIIAHNVK